MRVQSFVLAACAAGLVSCGSSGSDGTGDPSRGDNASANTPPSLFGTPVTVAWQGDAYQFTPRATDADKDPLLFRAENLPAWASFDPTTGRLHGTPGEADVGDALDIRIGVTDGPHVVWLAPFDLTVLEVSHGAVLLTWDPPTANTDTTPLEDLAGFNIYWGTDPDEPSETLTVTGAGITSYQFLSLAPGMYYFATTAVNIHGIESDLSERTSMLVR